MSLLLCAFMLGMTGKMIKDVAKDVTKIPARSQMQEDSKNGDFDVVKNFEQILYVNDVKRKSFGNSSVKVLPYNGIDRCMPFIRDHHLTSRADEQRFANHYKKVLSDELAERQKEFDSYYDEIASEVKYLIDTEDEYEIVRFEHIVVLVDYEDVVVKVDEISNNTFLGDFIVGDVKIKMSSSGNAFTEIWPLKVPVAMKLSLNRYYEACAEKCGYLY